MIFKNYLALRVFHRLSVFVRTATPLCSPFPTAVVQRTLDAMSLVPTEPWAGPSIARR